MKAELITVPKKGLCILISDIDVNEFLKKGLDIPNLNLTFSDPHTIASFIREKKGIFAIKEIRQQTGWGLKEAKQYLERYSQLGIRNGDQYYIDASNRFLEDHLPKLDFLGEDDMEI